MDHVPFFLRGFYVFGIQPCCKQTPISPDCMHFFFLCPSALVNIEHVVVSFLLFPASSPVYPSCRVLVFCIILQFSLLQRLFWVLAPDFPVFGFNKGLLSAILASSRGHLRFGRFLTSKSQQIHYIHILLCQA